LLLKFSQIVDKNNVFSYLKILYYNSEFIAPASILEVIEKEAESTKSASFFF